VGIGAAGSGEAAARAPTAAPPVAAATASPNWWAYRSAVAGQRLQGLGHHRGRRGVQPRRRLVEDQDRGVPDERAGDGQPLPLPSGQGRGPLAEDGVVAIGHGRDEVVGGRLLGRGDDVLGRRPLAAVGDVLRHGAAQQQRLLQHHADLLPQGVEGELPDVQAVDEDGARVRVVQPRQELGDRALARAAVSDERHGLAGGDPEAHGFQRQPPPPLVRAVGR
jgi:hypothetical protein